MGGGRPRVAVIGGGVIGCASAWELARRGAAVTVIERDRPVRRASRAAGGMLSPLGEAEGAGPFLDLALASFERYASFVDALEAASGVDVEYRTGGKLHVALDDAQAQRLDAVHGWKPDRGFEIARLSGDEARRREPALSPDLCAAFFIGPDHRVDNRRLGRALHTAAARAGVDFRLGAPAVRVVAEPGGGGQQSVRGVELADGAVVDADALVLAAGCWSAGIGGLPHPPPVFPVRGQMIALEMLPPLVERTVQGPGCYVIPRADGRLVIGSTMERVGFRAEPTAAGVAGLLDAARRLLPALGDARLVEVWAGLRPGTPDELPILGRAPDMHGLVYATGHFRNGILLTPITAAIVAHLVMGEAPPLALDAFAPDRHYAPAT